MGVCQSEKTKKQIKINRETYKAYKNDQILTKKTISTSTFQSSSENSTSSSSSNNSSKNNNNNINIINNNNKNNNNKILERFNTQQEKEISQKEKIYPEEITNLTVSYESLNKVFDKINYTTGSFRKDIRKIYKFVKVLGKGSFGSTRLAYKKEDKDNNNENNNNKINKFYAIKSISKKNLTEEKLKEMYNEVEITSKIHHPNVIILNETYHDNEYFHIVMEYCQGGDLFQKVKKNGKLNENLVKKIIFKILHAISYCHNKGFIHRDLKPENILFVNNDNNSSYIKIADFGLAYYNRNNNNNNKLHEIAGSPFYMAPEVLKGDYDYKCDIWSIGIITYFLLSGILPYFDNDIKNLFKKIIKEEVNYNINELFNVSNDAIDFIKRCLIKNPNKRLNANELLKHNWFNDVRNDIYNNENNNNINSYDINKKILYDFVNNKIVCRRNVFILHSFVNELNEKKLENYQNIFYLLDKENKGLLNAENIYNACKEYNIKTTLQDITNIIYTLNQIRTCPVENNNNYYLDFKQFMIASMEPEMYTKENLIKVFNECDINKNGYIDIEDFKNIYLRGGCRINADEEQINDLFKELLYGDKKLELKHFLLFENRKDKLL